MDPEFFTSDAPGRQKAPLLYLSAYFRRHRTAYVAHLREVSTRGAWREWIMFFLLGMVEQAADAVERAKRLQDLQLDWRVQLAHETKSVSLLSVVEALFEVPVLDSALVADRCQVSEAYARQIIRQLVGMGILARIPDTGRQRLYWSPPILDILQ